MKHYHFALWVCLLCLWRPVAAHEGEVHDDAAPQPAPVTLSTNAQSALFEVVASWQDGQLELALSDYTSNAPLGKAQIQMDLGEQAATLTPTAQAGIYRFKPSAPLPEETVLTITLGEQADLLPIKLPAPAKNTGTEVPPRKTWKLPLLLGGAALALLGLLLWQKRQRKLTALALFVGLLMAKSTPLWAHAGEEHGPPPSEITGALPGDSFTLSKAVQFRTGLRTAVAQPAQVRALTRLNARIGLPPQAHAVVSAPDDSVLRYAPDLRPGLPVRAGQVLFRVQHAISVSERLAVEAEINQAQGRLDLLEDQLRRARSLEGVIPAQETEKLRLERDRAQTELRLREQALQGGAGTLKAPINGVLERLLVGNGQIVSAATPLAEIIDPAQRWVEAEAFEQTPLPARIEQAWLERPGQPPLALRHLSTAQALDPASRALKIYFALPRPASLAVGSAATVAVAGAKQTGITVPAQALRQRHGQTQVLVMNAAEQFTWRPVVRAAPLEAGMAGLLRGVAAGERIVVSGFPAQ